MRKKSPYLRTSSFSNMAVRGGLTRFARPCGAAHSLRSRSVQLAAPLLGPSLGLAPAGPAHALFKIAPGNFVSNPGRRFSSPQGRAICEKKSPYLRTSSFSNMAVRGGLTRFARPFGAAHSLRSRSVQLAAPVVEPRSGVLIPPTGVQQAKKKPVLAYELFLKYGGEGGIRTPDTLPYTHFPGVLLQPLGHLTILFCCSP